MRHHHVGPIRKHNGEIQALSHPPIKLFYTEKNTWWGNIPSTSCRLQSRIISAVTPGVASNPEKTQHKRGYSKAVPGPELEILSHRDTFSIPVFTDCSGYRMSFTLWSLNNKTSSGCCFSLVRVFQFPLFLDVDQLQPTLHRLPYMTMEQFGRENFFVHSRLSVNNITINMAMLKLC